MNRTNAGRIVARVLLRFCGHIALRELRQDAPDLLRRVETVRR